MKTSKKCIQLRVDLYTHYSRGPIARIPKIRASAAIFPLLHKCVSFIVIRLFSRNLIGCKTSIYASIDPCSKNGDFLTPLQPFIKLVRFRVPRFINQMHYAVEYIMTFLLSGHRS